jgi:hypothetical protein
LRILGFSLVEGGGHGHAKKQMTIRTHINFGDEAKTLFIRKNL